MMKPLQKLVREWLPKVNASAMPAYHVSLVFGVRPPETSCSMRHFSSFLIAQAYLRWNIVSEYGIARCDANAGANHLIHAI